MMGMDMSLDTLFCYDFPNLKNIGLFCFRLLKYAYNFIPMKTSYATYYFVLRSLCNAFFKFILDEPK